MHDYWSHCQYCILLHRHQGQQTHASCSFPFEQADIPQQAVPPSHIWIILLLLKDSFQYIIVGGCAIQSWVWYLACCQPDPSALRLLFPLCSWMATRLVPDKLEGSACWFRKDFWTLMRIFIFGGKAGQPIRPTHFSFSIPEVWKWIWRFIVDSISFGGWYLMSGLPKLSKCKIFKDVRDRLYVQ